MAASEASNFSGSSTQCWRSLKGSRAFARAQQTLNAAVAALRFGGQMGPLGHAPPFAGEAAQGDRFAHVLQQGIVRAGEGFVHADPEVIRIIAQMRRFFAIAAAAAGMGLAVSLALLARDIERESSLDEAQPADVIVVLGAAEYRGSPSPVLKARLDHALTLHQRGLARAS